MNIQNGLQRISAVWWGLWALLALALLGDGVIHQRADNFWAGLIGLAGLYVAHRITCWVVAGFFAPRS